MSSHGSPGEQWTTARRTRAQRRSAMRPPGKIFVRTFVCLFFFLVLEMYAEKNVTQTSQTAVLLLDHTDPAEEPAHLQERAKPLDDAHVTRSNLLDHLELNKLGCLVALGNAEERGDDVRGTVSRLEEAGEKRIRVVHLPLKRRGQHGVDVRGVRLVANLEYVLRVDEPESAVCRLQVVECLPHVAVRREHHRLEPVVDVRHLLAPAYVQQPLDHLLVAELGEPDDGTSALYGFDDLRTLVARECESRGCGVDFHRASQRLLACARHAVRLVENNHLVPSRRQGNLFLREDLDFVAHDVDSSLVRRVEFEHRLLHEFRVSAEQCAREAHD
mmetsp:Transcript_4410/g.9869  ORF Transcript_4410/g.9869 Transcript_4410/m.9869 type:complete len:330 (-) Transcript_4410:182-1171(-)